MLNMILRMYASGWSSRRDQANQALASAVCSRSSAAAESRVSRYAARSSRGDRVTTNSSYSAVLGTGTLPPSRTGFAAAAEQPRKVSSLLLHNEVRLPGLQDPPPR